MMSLLRCCASFSARVRFPSSSILLALIFAISSFIARISAFFSASLAFFSSSRCSNCSICRSCAATAFRRASLSPVRLSSRSESWCTEFSVARFSASFEETPLRSSA